jgi:hypothetical protein
MRIEGIDDLLSVTVKKVRSVNLKMRWLVLTALVVEGRQCLCPLGADVKLWLGALDDLLLPLLALPADVLDESDHELPI